MIDIDRRFFLAGLGTAALLGLGGRAFAASVPAPFKMWRGPGCGCCLQWKQRMEAAFGRAMEVVDSPDMAAVKLANSVPADLQGCHTALVGTVVVEGHVPPADVRRLLGMRNSGFKGLAVPGMPLGAPGMEVPAGEGEPFKVYAFTGRGTRSLFVSYGEAA